MKHRRGLKYSPKSAIIDYGEYFIEDPFGLFHAHVFEIQIKRRKGLQYPATVERIVFDTQDMRRAKDPVQEMRYRIALQIKRSPRA